MAAAAPMPRSRSQGSLSSHESPDGGSSFPGLAGRHDPQARRPSGSRAGPGMIRLPSDGPGAPQAPAAPPSPLLGPQKSFKQSVSLSRSSSGSQSRPGSSSAPQAAAGRATMSRLPDAAPGPAARPGPTPAAPASPAQGSTARDRMKMKLSVNTETKPASGAHERAVFRLLKRGEAVQDLFEFEEELQACGERGRVVCAKRRADGREVVVKIRAKRSNQTTERNWRTVMGQLHQMCGSRHVLDITEILEDDKFFYIVMPKCNGGELFEFLITEAEVPESECKRICKEILVAVGHLHENNLIHRDVKPENLLFDLDVGVPKGSPKTVKLIDFDTCMEWTPQTPKSRQFVGTPGYIAPEALLGEASPQSDLWSVGVILYILMTGETPWTQIQSLEDGCVGSPGARRMYDSLKRTVMDWDSEPWPSFPEARDLCQKLTAFKTEDRIESVAEALSHVWLAGC